MEFKEFLDTFVRYNKRIYKKLIIISIILFYLLFLIYYNHFRIILDNTLNFSWQIGIISAFITTISLVFIADIIRVLLLIKSERT